MASRRLICPACGDEPFWNIPRVGDPCWCGEGNLEVKEIPTGEEEVNSVRNFLDKMFSRTYTP